METVKQILDIFIDTGNIDPVYAKCITIEEDGFIVDLDCLEPLLGSSMNEDLQLFQRT
jgi:hypothetical protein